MLNRGNKPLSKGNKQLSRGSGGLKRSTLNQSSSKGLARGKSKLKTNPPSKEKLDKYVEMKAFFQLMWGTRPHYSEVSGDWLSGYCFGREFISMFQHHILPKEPYPEASLDPENIIFLTPEEHSQVEKDINCFEEVNTRRIKLLLKYENTTD